MTDAGPCLSPEPEPETGGPGYNTESPAPRPLVLPGERKVTGTQSCYESLVERYYYLFVGINILFVSPLLAQERNILDVFKDESINIIFHFHRKTLF